MSLLLERNTLAHKDGWLCVRCVMTDYSEPRFVAHYWPIGRYSKAELEHWQYPIGAELKRTGTATYYAPDHRHLRSFELIDGGSTKPIATDIIPAERPKSRGKELRWKNGEWQILLKKGWTFQPFVSIP